MTRAGRSRKLRFQLLLVLALTVVVAWSVLWFVAATFVDRQVERAEMAARRSGSRADCARRSVSGYPFRVELRCHEGTGMSNSEVTVTVGGVTAVAQIYAPRLVIAEFAPPLRIDSDDAPPLEVDWTLAHASARVNVAREALDRLDAEVIGAQVMVGGEPLQVGEADLNLRRSPQSADDLDVALTLRDVRSLAGVPLAVSLRGRLGNGAALLNGRSEALLALLAREGLPLTVETAQVRSGEAEIAFAGTLTLGPEGKLNGKLEVAIAAEGEDLPNLPAMAPQTREALTSVIDAVLDYAPETTIGERSAKKLTLLVRDSRVQAGFVPLFTLPPIVIAER